MAVAVTGVDRDDEKLKCFWGWLVRLDDKIKAEGGERGKTERETERGVEVRKSLTLLLVVWCRGSISEKTQ